LLWIAATPLAALALLVAYTPLVRSVGDSFIRRDTLPARVDAIAVLGMGFTPDGLMKSEGLDRLLSGLAIAKQRPATPLLISSEHRLYGMRAVSDSGDEARIIRLVNPPTEIIFVDSVFTTRTEAVRMKAIAGRRRWSSIAVVTSPLHTRRACATFEATGFRVFCVPATGRNSGLLADSNAEDRLRSFRSWLYELFASASYRSRGWIK
jgi:uncharacterized SAM-binding protein YcdF (DUF218 family)